MPASLEIVADALDGLVEFALKWRALRAKVFRTPAGLRARCRRSVAHEEPVDAAEKTLDAFDPGFLPVQVAIGRRSEQAIEARGIGTVARTISSGETTLPRLFDILAPSLITMPWVKRRVGGLVVFDQSRCRA